MSYKLFDFFRDPGNLLVVHYSDLKTNLQSQLTKILNFLDVTAINPAIMNCVITNREGKFHRPKSHVLSINDVVDKDMLSYSKDIQSELRILLKYKTSLYWVDLPVPSVHSDSLHNKWC